MKFTGIQAGLLGDEDPDSFAEGTIEQAELAQAHLGKGESQGVAVRLQFETRREGCPIYAIHTAPEGDAKGTRLGRMSEKFGWDLWRAIKDLQGYKPKKFPTIIQNLWVKELCTVVGNLNNEQVPRALRQSGLWIGLRVEGMGTCRIWE